MVRKRFNDYKINGETATIIIVSKGKEYECLVDYEDISKLLKFGYRWSINTWGYAFCRPTKDGKSKTILMHRMLTDPTDKELVDHINHNKLDNRKCNLRNVDSSENNYNRKGAASNNKSSGIRGVFYDNSTTHKNKWRAHHSFKGKKIYVGRFGTKEEAEEAIIKARSDEYQEFKKWQKGAREQ